MILAFLLASAAAPTVIDAERAFAAAAQTEGQWTAFRAFAAPDAVMFVPELVQARDWLKGRKDPPIAVMWWPARAIISCDGRAAVTTGPWLRKGGARKGYFTTIWIRQPDGGWKWAMDHGDVLGTGRPAGQVVQIARPDCRTPPGTELAPAIVGHRTASSVEQLGASQDRTLSWRWRVNADGSRVVQIDVWNGRRNVTAIKDEVAGGR